MKKLPWILLASSMAMAAPFACGTSSTSGTATNSGSGGTGGSSATTNPASSSSHSAGPSSGTGTNTGGGTADCTGILQENDCVMCLETSCCAELAACNDDGTCGSCEFDPNTDPSDPTCSADPTAGLIAAFDACSKAKCTDACTPKDECNPVTNDGCAATDECDLNTAGAFVCFAPPFTQKLCETCSNTDASKYCAVGLHCDDSTATPYCARYCCTDEDCGPNNTCDVTYFTETALVPGDAVGICRAKNASDGGPLPDGGGPDNGLACDAPATSTSKGACVAGFPPKP